MCFPHQYQLKLLQTSLIVVQVKYYFQIDSKVIIVIVDYQIKLILVVTIAKLCFQIGLKVEFTISYQIDLIHQMCFVVVIEVIIQIDYL